MAQQKQPAKDDKSVRNRIASNGDIVVAEHYEGLIPHPQTLVEYDKIVPGSAADIITDFKENAKVIRELRVRELELTAERDKRGQWMAFALGVLIIGLAFFALHTGYAWVAGGACFIAVGSIGAAFLKNKK